MADATVDGRGPQQEWAPDKLPKPSPLFTCPLRLVPILRGVFVSEGLLWPQNALYLGVAILSWWVFTRFTGELTRAATFRIGWIAELYLHNVAMMLVFAGLPHLRLYIKRAQGRRYKYNPKWLSTNNPTFCSATRPWTTSF